MASVAMKMVTERLDQLKGRHERLVKSRDEIEAELSEANVSIANSNRQIAELELWIDDHPEEA